MEERQIPQIDDEISPLDYFIVLLKRKVMILIITFACVVITAIISLRMPEIYRAEAKILPPQQTGMSAKQFGGAIDMVGGMFGMGSPNALYVEMFWSRAVMESIIERLGLLDLYGAETVEGARGRLSGNLNVRSSRRSGVITVSVDDRDPQMAADIANAFVEELRNLTKRIAITEAAKRRVFFAEQLKGAKESLIGTEENMARFQAETGALKIDEQAKAVIAAIAGIKARIVEKEVQLKVMETYSTPNNPDLQKIKEALKGLGAALKKLETGQSKGYDPLMSTEKMSEVTTEYVRKLRELKFSETLYNLLLKQYEAARLDEARETVVIQVLDMAIPPEKRAKPKRTRMVMIAAGAGFFFAIFMAFLVEYKEKISGDPGHRERLEILRRYIALRPKK